MDTLKLSQNSIELNRLSDLLNQQVAIVDDSLRKLGLGIRIWIDAGPRLQLGYTRVEGKWGIAINEMEIKKVWLFGRAPREHRLVVIKYLDELIEQLTNESESLITRTGQAIELASLHAKIAKEILGNKNE